MTKRREMIELTVPALIDYENFIGNFNVKVRANLYDPTDWEPLEGKSDSGHHIPLEYLSAHICAFPKLMSEIEAEIAEKVTDLILHMAEEKN